MADVSSAIKHFPTAKEGFTTTTSGSISPGATSVGLSSVAGLTNGDYMVFVIDPTDSTKKQAFAGTVDVSGTQITNVIWTEGTNTTHSTGATVVDYETATHWALYNKGMLVEHDQDGTHKNVTTDTLTATGNVSVGGTLSVTGYAQDKGKFLYELRDEYTADFTVSGGVWSGDSYGSTLAASMTAWTGYINGQRGTISAVTARSFTASKDTYVDVLNSSGTFSLVYTEVANNAASPALASNSVRIAIIVTGGSSIAAATSINQGQSDRTLPIASSIAYTVTDSLGNLIYNLSSSPILIGYRYLDSYGSPGATSHSGVLSTPIIVPTGRRIKVTAAAGFGNYSTSQSSYSNLDAVIDGSATVASGVGWLNGGSAQSNNNKPTAIGVYTPAAGSHAITLSISMAGYQMSAISTLYIMVELV